jgi:hypothetical protein
MSQALELRRLSSGQAVALAALAPPAVIERRFAPRAPIDADAGQHEVDTRQSEAGPFVPTTTPHELAPSPMFYSARWLQLAC